MRALSQLLFNGLGAALWRCSLRPARGEKPRSAPGERRGEAMIAGLIAGLTVAATVRFLALHALHGPAR